MQQTRGLIADLHTDGLRIEKIDTTVKVTDIAANKR